MARKPTIRLVLWLVQVALLCVATTLPVTADESTLKTASSSRQSKTFSYQPFGGNLGRKNLPLVQVKINDSFFATFFLDTGFNTSIITDRVAAKLKSKNYPVILQGKAYTFGGKPVNAVTLDSINLGGSRFEKGMFLVLKENRIALPGQPVDGVIGIDILQYMECLFDFQQHRITMFAPVRLTKPRDGSPQEYVAGGLTPDEIKALGFADAKGVAIIDSQKDGRKYVHVQCSSNGKSGGEDLLLDTGATTTIISPTLAGQLALKPVSENVEESGFPGIEYISTAPLERFQLGDLTLQDLPIDYSSQPAYDKNLTPALGVNVLSKYRVLMDFPGHRLYLKPLSAAVLPTITIRPTRQIVPLAPAVK